MDGIAMGEVEELVVCGLAAAQAVIRRRPAEILRVYLTRDRAPHMGEFLCWYTDHGGHYYVVGDGVLDRIAGTIYHEGVVLLVRPPPAIGAGELLARICAEPSAAPRALIYLDGAPPPAALGPLIRVAAHFAADAILVAGEVERSPQAIRQAEGGAEAVPLVPVSLGPEPLLRLRAAGFQLLALAERGAPSLFARAMPARVVALVAAGAGGLAPAIRALAAAVVAAPGSGAVPGLGLTGALTVLLAEHWRVRREEPGSAAPPAPGVDLRATARGYRSIAAPADRGGDPRLPRA